MNIIDYSFLTLNRLCCEMQSFFVTSLFAGGRVKVDFFNVDKRFWRVDLGQNWAMSSMLTHFE